MDDHELRKVPVSDPAEIARMQASQPADGRPGLARRDPEDGQEDLLP